MPNCIADAADQEWALRMLEEHPAFAIAGAWLLRSGIEMEPEALRQLRARVMLNSPDRQAMADYAKIGGSDWRDFYPRTESAERKSTDDTIADFIDAYGQTSPQEDALLERLIFNPVTPDYLEADDGPEGLYWDPNEEPKPVQEQKRKEPEVVKTKSQEEAKKSAIEEMAPKTQQKRQNVAENPSMMESLAKIFVKQGRYSRAFEIISDLSLKYPEKSVYFADQLRFLQKLMVNQLHQPKV